MRIRQNVKIPHNKKTFQHGSNEENRPIWRNKLIIGYKGQIIGYKGQIITLSFAKERARVS
jgi:hypothetical protein